MVIFTWVAIVLLALATVFLLILAVPVEFTFRAARGDGTRPRFSVRWLFGLVNREFRASESDETSDEKKADEVEQATRSTGRASRGFAAGMQFDAITRLIGLGWQLFRKVELKEFVVRGRFGTGDPGQTGTLYGMSHAMTGLANRRQNVNIRLTPSYIDAVVEGEIYGTVRVVPIRLLFTLAGFLVRPSNVRAVIRLRRATA